MSLPAVSVGIILSLAASVVPTLAYVLVVWWIDRYEKEPIRLLVAAFLWGALPAVLVAVLLESVTSEAIVAIAGIRNHLVDASLIAPPVEETVKALSLVAIFYLAREEFDGVLDGIIYGSIVGFGFAATENLFFFVKVWREGSFLDWGRIVLGRAFAFGLNHAMFTSLTGIGLGLARYEASARKRSLFAFAGFVAAIMAHSLHNLFLSMGPLCFVSLVADWLGVTVVLAMVILSWRRERSRLETQLADEVEGGVLTQHQYEAILSRRGRIVRGWGLAGSSEANQTRLWRRFVRAATELAFAKHRQEKAGGPEARSAPVTALRSQIVRIRQRMGETALAESRICARCGRPSVQIETQACPHCDAP